MKRSRRIVLPVGTLACLALAGALAAGCGGSGSSSQVSGRSPACLPKTLSHSAKLPGLALDVSPAPETGMANPNTQISFLGVPATHIHRVSVVGEQSGSHPGQLRAYSQGDGASFVPDAPFRAGERVSVHAMIGADSSGKRIGFGFRVDTPSSTADVGEFPNPTASPADYQSFVTLPGIQAPILNITMADRDPAAGDILTTNGPGPGRYGPLIYTPQGQLVWFHQLSGGISAENLSVQSYEGRRDLTYWQGKVLSLGFGQGEDIVMSSNYRTIAKISGGNGLKADLHDFQITPHDISYTTAFNVVRCDLSPDKGASDGAIIDTAVQEIDMKTGLVRWEWHSLDHVGTSESKTDAPTTTRPWDWFHINSIDHQPNGNLLISARNTWAAYQLQSGTGNILWRLGGTKSSFHMGSGTTTAWQHDGRILPNGEVTLFDDGSNPPVHRQSRAVRIALDFKTHQALLRSALTHPGALLSASQGNVQTLADGNTVVNYGGIPAISEYASNGSLLFDAHLPFELDTYRGFRFQWIGRPLSPPIGIANLNNTSEETIVHMSWNGATDVASWRVLAGKQPGSLNPGATIRSSGFESSTILPDKYAYVAVQALDSAGRTLSTSKPTRVVSYAASFPTAPQSE